MVFDEAVAFSIEAQVDLTDPADHIWPQNVPLPAAVLAGLVVGVDRGMEQGHIKPQRSIRGVAAVSPERHEDINRGSGCTWKWWVPLGQDITGLWLLQLLNTWLRKFFNNRPATARALMFCLYMIQAFVRCTSIAYANIRMYHLLDFMGVR